MSAVIVTTAEELASVVRKAVDDALAARDANPPREILTLAQAAELLDRHPKSVMTLVKSRGLPAHFISERQPRFRRSELLAWLSAQGKGEP